MSATRLALAAAAAITMVGSAQAGPLSLGLNKTETIRVGSPASGVVVGNPMIADVAVHNPNLIFVTGKNYGSTNILIVDQHGRQLFSKEVVVVDESPNQIVIRHGNGDATYTCAPTCVASPRTGDDVNFHQKIYNQRETEKQAAETE